MYNMTEIDGVFILGVIVQVINIAFIIAIIYFMYMIFKIVRHHYKKTK